MTIPSETFSTSLHLGLSRTQAFFKGIIAIFPLSIAVIPWGILAGSLAIDAGLSAVETQLMSLTIFAGAAQLVAVGMLKAGVGLGGILLSTCLITSRHCLYALTLRETVSPLAYPWRLGLGFLLTDELFAVAVQKKEMQKTGALSPWFLLGAGVSFYCFWNASTLFGIVAIQALPELNQWGLEFAIVATFIAIIIPMLKHYSTFACVITTGVCAVFFEWVQIQAGLLLSALLGMSVGAVYAKLAKETIE
ncbi:AzlC family ABC transporter permease [uncultured Shewanella sp.]|uniref:AzlC family ABC transporter permease n=1 Tax=uncultured Shewanella sp. TaxID=173975 RepID=UPI0026339AEB|nr:AzlC family ABC transporter permease [uncultured Shewanella sp.]